MSHLTLTDREGDGDAWHGNASHAMRVAAFYTGRFDEARLQSDWLRGAMELRRQPRVKAMSAAALLLLDLAQGSDSGAIGVLEPLLDDARRRGFRGAVNMYAWAPGAWALSRGDIEAGVRELVAWRDEHGEENLRWASTGARPFVTHALLAADRLDEAGADIEASRAMSNQLGPLHAARHHHVEGLLLRAQGDVLGAERLHYENLGTQCAGGWRPDLAHTLEALAGIASGHEAHVECVRLAGAARALRNDMGYMLRWPFEQRLLDADLSASRSALGDEAFETAFTEGDALGEEGAVEYATRARGERRRPTTGWAALTPTEGEVARLAGEGLTNKQIGQRLLMGSETVKTHLSRVYDKIGVRSRAGLTPPGKQIHGGADASRPT